MYTHNLMHRMQTNFRQNKRTPNTLTHISVTTTKKNAFLLLLFFFFYFIHIICIKCNPHQDHWLLIRPVTMTYFQRWCQWKIGVKANTLHTKILFILNVTQRTSFSRKKSALKHSSWVHISQFTVSELHENIINKER